MRFRNPDKYQDDPAEEAGASLLNGSRSPRPAGVEKWDHMKKEVVELEEQN